MISARALCIVGLGFLLPVMTAGAQPVLLQIRPRFGDTLAVRLDQRIEMTAVPSGRQMTRVIEVFSRAIVLQTSITGSRLLAVTDSVRTGTAPGIGKQLKAQRSASGSGTMELRVATDGGAEVVNADASNELRAVFDQMPATLSRRAVSVGDTWEKQMRIPISTERGASGMVKATFRLDSLGRNGDVAYISMKGTLSHDHRDGSDSEVDGSISGTMQLDRRLAWITDTRAMIDVESTVKPPGGGPPMRVRTKVMQVLRARPMR